MTPSPNVEALRQILDGFGDFNPSWSAALADFLASPEVLATEALTDVACAELAREGVQAFRAQPTSAEASAHVRSALARLARGEG